MKLVVFFLVVTYLLSIECYSDQDRNHLLLYHPQLMKFIETYFNAHHECIQCILENSLSSNCSQYKNDEKILKSFLFYVESNSKQANPSRTLALKNKNNNIYLLNMLNEKFFPPTAFCLKYLEKLYVHSTSFVIFNDQLPSIIKVWAQSLTHLDILHTTITHLPSEIGDFMQLQRLKLSDTGLVSLPDEIGSLSSLIFLSLSDNKLTFLPKTMKNLRSLKQLILTNNPYLRSIESITGLSSLQILQINHCSIEHIPLKLSQLMYLSMSNNKLTNLTGIETLGFETNNKKSFYFDKNHIQFIPSEFQYIRNPSKLNLNDNKLENLPWSMLNIQTLDYLYIKNNKFNDDDLKQIIKIFKYTNPKLTLTYLNDMNSTKKL